MPPNVTTNERGFAQLVVNQSVANTVRVTGEAPVDPATITFVDKSAPLENEDAVRPTFSHRCFGLVANFKR